MKPTGRFIRLHLLSVLLLLGGCSQQADEHAGHNHAAAGHRQAGEAPPAAAVAPCAAHGAPKTACFICAPSLREKGRLWCGEHDRYEDRCWLCHPDLRDPDRPYCDAHGLYEDECVICRPAPRATTAPADPARLVCREHDVFEDECGICHPELTGGLTPGQGLKVRLPATDSAQIVGVQTVLPRVGATADSVDCLAELVFNQNKLAQIVAPVPGILQHVGADLGDPVAESASLARLWSAGIAETVARAVLSHQTLAREKQLHAEGIVPAKDLEEAAAAHRAACQQARTLGFSEADIDALGRQPDEPVHLEIRAPFAGEIIERTAVRGALVETGQPLFTLADRSTMWAMLSLPETELAGVRTGQVVELTVDALPGRTFTGRLTWVAAQVDTRTRLARARAELPNPDGLLRAQTFARARILTRTADNALLIPAAALQQVEGRPLVFVRLADDLYEARGVRLGAKHNGTREVLAGLRPDEPVVVARGFALKSQLLISRLGAGCADD